MFPRMSPAMVGIRKSPRIAKGALMQTLRVCVRQRRCLCTPPRGYAPPWNPRPKACRLWTPALGLSRPKTHDKGRACPSTQPGEFHFPSTPDDQPCADWMCASTMPRWTVTQGALLPENPARDISLSRPMDDRLTGQARAAFRRCITSRSAAPAPCSRLRLCLP